MRSRLGNDVGIASDYCQHQDCLMAEWLGPASHTSTPRRSQPILCNYPDAPPRFTGHYTLKLVCGAGTTNQGATFATTSLEVMFGNPVGGGTTGGSCTGFVGGSFSLDVTVTLGTTTTIQFLGVSGPHGFAMTQVYQS